MDRKTLAGGAGGEGEDEQQTERPVSGCLGRAPRGLTRAGLAFASARDPSLRDLRVHTDGRARQALSASSHLLNRLLHRASSPSESRHRTRGSAPTSRTSQTDRRRRQGNRGERLAPLTGARTGWGARSPSIPAARVVRHVEVQTDYFGWASVKGASSGGVDSGSSWASVAGGASLSSSAHCL